ncbi:hypothetical protein Tco_1070455 [Tanacetum coccineum]|uniref:Uncharacterized protein n=1 Tax=Tanacetum coccineum TaxID=301880 RepID=A0ABQ5HLL6_9ASTR
MKLPFRHFSLWLFVLNPKVTKRYGYIKNHKKTVKNGQARTRESEEYKKKPKNQSRSQKSQATVKEKSTHGQQKCPQCDPTAQERDHKRIENIEEVTDVKAWKETQD